MRKRQRPWQNIIWREWRNCENKKYAESLFTLVADKPVGWGTTATLALLGMLHGAMGGLLVGLVATNRNVWGKPGRWELLWSSVWIFVWLGVVLGGGVALGIKFFSADRRFTWRIFAPQTYSIELSRVLCGWLCIWAIVVVSIGLGSMVTTVMGLRPGFVLGLRPGFIFRGELGSMLGIILVGVLGSGLGLGVLIIGSDDHWDQGLICGLGACPRNAKVYTF